MCKVVVKGEGRECKVREEKRRFGGGVEERGKGDCRKDERQSDYRQVRPVIVARAGKARLTGQCAG